ncbi:hypothetical protein FRC12_002353 [Ceratobasidium sp. 428]|nr:hypothetical protein FRC09_008273 [Ceratobasidium sp. 395]KAG8793558.1 hypothetical protein FRC12_002353 [Ceratobasidium sp. 428]
MNTQLVLDDSLPTLRSHHLLFIPAFGAAFSALVLIIQKFSSGLHLRSSTLNRSVQNAHATPRLFSSGFPLATTHRSRPDPNARAKAWKIFRLAACFVLIILSIAAISLAEPCQKTIPDENNTLQDSEPISEMKFGFGHGRGHGRKHKKHHSTDFCLSQQQTEQLVLGVFYVYVTILALLAVALESVFRALCNSHVVLLLFLALMVDVWVVILPTATFWIPTPSGTPLDWVSRARVVILVFAAIIISIYIQRSQVQHEQFVKSSLTNPMRGRLMLKNLTARYSPDGPAALSRVSFTINPGQRVCVIGKAGSGKRTLALSLLRAIETQGKMYLDGISTHTIAPEALHSHLTFIAEQPGITYGSVRETLNPQQLYNDIALQSTLRSVGLEVELGALVDELSEEERVRVLLAKAITCRSKVVILEEGDDELTDTVRSILHTRLPDSTFIILTTVLHFVRDVDKILVLDAGRVEEFGSPGDLLRKWSGPFKKMVDASEIKAELYARLCR